MRLDTLYFIEIEALKRHGYPRSVDETILTLTAEVRRLRRVIEGNGYDHDDESWHGSEAKKSMLREMEA